MTKIYHVDAKINVLQITFFFTLSYRGGVKKKKKKKLLLLLLVPFPPSEAFRLTIYNFVTNQFSLISSFFIFFSFFKIIICLLSLKLGFLNGWLANSVVFERI